MLCHSTLAVTPVDAVADACAGMTDESQRRPAVPELRLADMDRDGVQTQVMFGPIFSISTDDPVRAERSNYYDAGIQQTLSKAVTVGIDTYYKQAIHLIDEGQFGAPIILTPFNYQHGQVYGVEFTGSYTSGHFQAYGNVALQRAIGKHFESSQFNFSPSQLAYVADHYIHLDHEQQVTMSGGAAYQWHGTRVSGDILVGSGLRASLVLADGSTIPNGAHLPGVPGQPSQPPSPEGPPLCRAQGNHHGACSTIPPTTARPIFPDKLRPACCGTCWTGRQRNRIRWRRPRPGSWLMSHRCCRRPGACPPAPTSLFPERAANGPKNSRKVDGSKPRFSAPSSPIRSSIAP